MEHCMAHRLGQWVTVCTVSVTDTHLYNDADSARKIVPSVPRKQRYHWEKFACVGNLLKLRQHTQEQLAFEGNPVKVF